MTILPSKITLRCITPSSSEKGHTSSLRARSLTPLRKVGSKPRCDICTTCVCSYRMQHSSSLSALRVNVVFKFTHWRIWCQIMILRWSHVTLNHQRVYSREFHARKCIRMCSGIRHARSTHDIVSAPPESLAPGRARSNSRKFFLGSLVWRLPQHDQGGQAFQKVTSLSGWPLPSAACTAGTA